MPDYQVILNIDGDEVTLHDFSGRDLVRDNSFTRTQTLHRDLEPVQDKCTFTIDFVQSIANSLLTIDYDAIVTVEILEDNAPYFKGVVRPVTSYSINTEDRTIEIEALDNSWRLERKISTTITLTDNTITQILNKLLTDAGYSATERADIPTISTELPIFEEVAGDKTFKRVVTELLFQFGYVYYFDEAGVFQAYEWINDTIATTGGVNSDNIVDELKVDRDDERVGAKIDPNGKGEKLQLYKVESETRQLRILFRLPKEFFGAFSSGTEYPSSSTFTFGDDALKDIFELRNIRILKVANAEGFVAWRQVNLITRKRTYRSATFTSTGNLGNGLSVKEYSIDYANREGTLQFETTEARIELWTYSVLADITIQYEQESVEIDIPFGSFPIENAYLRTQSQVQRLATGIRRRFDTAIYQYEFRSEDEFDIGEYVQLQSPDLNIDTDVRIIEKAITYNDGVMVYTYRAEGVSALGSLLGTVTPLAPPSLVTRADREAAEGAALAGLTDGGQVALPISGNAMTPPPFEDESTSWDPGEDGLFFTNEWLGFYDSETETWPVRIQNDDGTGKARFGNDTRYMEWDGSNLNIQGNAQSPNFDAGEAGWRIDVDGSAEFNDVTIRGTIESGSGTIGGWTIGANALSAGSMTLGDDGSITATNFGVNAAGNLSATAGTIGNWTIDDPDLRDNDSRVLLRPDLRRFEIRDALGAQKIALGYFDGVSGFDAAEYGLYIAPGNTVRIEGGADFRDGSYLIEQDAAYLVLASDGNEAGRFGSLGSGDVGLSIGRFVQSFRLMDTDGVVIFDTDDGEILTQETDDTAPGLYYSLAESSLRLNGDIELAGDNVFYSGFDRETGLPTDGGFWLQGVDGPSDYTFWFGDDDNFFRKDAATGTVGLRIVALEINTELVTVEGDLTIEAEGDASGDLIAAGGGTFGGDVTVDGDLDVSGETIVGVASGNEIRIKLSDAYFAPTQKTHRSFDAPAGFPSGITIDPATGNLISCDAFTDRIYIHDGISSTISSDFASPNQSPSGVAIDPTTGNLISIDGFADRIYIHDGISSTTLSDFAAPGSTSSGIAIDPATGNLISSDRTDDRIYIHDGISATILDDFASPSESPYGVAIDPSTGNLISCDNSTDRIYIHDGISSTILYDFASPDRSPTGVAIDPKTGNLISCDANVDRIYVYDTEIRLRAPRA